ncbi:patatin-like phospholipase family protein [Arenibacter latericius]|uniref:patatin-like phospholipase family protein n=1 Tax=Arenibacter latericius TaxID=86104 RepID=UPI0003FBACF2|nr:patatin-like phospholipase family protein [Arenibacter latericius]
MLKKTLPKTKYLFNKNEMLGLVLIALQKNVLILVLLFLWVAPHTTVSQDKKPKVALVLSGGGAKGIAHIPTLQMLDSLGIVPDLVVGNSMGSIVGALYAMGYSGDSIANIAKNARWDDLIGGGVSLRTVSAEEKFEFRRYLVEFNWADGNLKLGNFLLNDQNLRDFISTLTYPSYNTSNFDELAIPFRAVATDIVNGKEVILDRGSLGFAMRASMSIPGVFSPVRYKETLLVDGGLLNNFPVDIAKDMGADIIIGSDVGGGMASKEKLNSFTALMFQAGMMTSNLKIPQNRELCDILIDHTPNLTYSTADFLRSDIIYEEGKIAVHRNMNSLIALSERLKKYEQRPHQLPVVQKRVSLDSVVYHGISDNNLALVRARTNIKAHKSYSISDIMDGVNRAMGTTIFSQITYNPIVDKDSIQLHLHGIERSQHQVKGSLHYDGDNGVGVIVNYTGRNIIGNASRSLVTLDIADQPKFRIQHQKNFGHDRDWWWRSEAFGHRLRQKVFVGGKYADDISYRYFNFDNQFNRNLSSLRSYVGFGLKFHNTRLSPTIDSDVKDNVLQINKYKNSDTELYAHYRYNSMNDVHYATHGAILKGYLGRSLHNSLEVISSDVNVPDINGSTNEYTRIGLDYEKRFRVNDRSAGILGLSGHFIFEDVQSRDDLSFSELGLNSKYFIGGNSNNPGNDNFVFPGLHQGELSVTQFAKLKLGLQINALNKVYITPHIDMASVGFGRFKDYLEDAFIPKGDWSESIEPSILMSAGTTFSYNSILGPINFDVSWVNSTDRVRFFIGIGYQFNVSD